MCICVFFVCFLEHSVSPFIQIFDLSYQFLKFSAYRSCTCFVRFIHFFFFSYCNCCCIFHFGCPCVHCQYVEIIVCFEIINFCFEIIDFYIVAHDLAELSSPRSFLGRFLGIFLASYHITGFLFLPVVPGSVFYCFLFAQRISFRHSCSRFSSFSFFLEC